MNKTKYQKVIAVGMFVIILLGMLNYFSWDDFLKPLGKEVLHGYQKTAESDTVSQRINAVKGNIEKMIGEISFKDAYINLNTLAQTSLGIKTIEDADYEVGKMNNGQLTFMYETKGIDQNSIVSCAENVAGLNDQLQQKGIDFLYLQAPFKINKYDPQLPPNLKEYTNDKIDLFVDELNSRGVDLLDFREEIHHAGIDQADLYFKTDHHWKPEGAFWCFGKTAEVLNEQYGFSINSQHTDLANYNVDVYKNWFLGSIGKRVGTIWAGTDDISLITPKFETNFTFQIPSKKVKKSGSFDKALISYGQINEKDYYNKNPYAAYTGGDFPLNNIKNHNNPNGKKVLLVRDSYACAFSPFLALACSELDIIDLRHYKEKSLMAYIEETKPDMVLMLYHTTSIREATMTFDRIY